MVAFQGKGGALTAVGLAAAATAIGVGVAEIWTVLSVETLGAGFLSDRRPLILFERHVFSARTGGRFDTRFPDISNSTCGGYGQMGAAQYDRLAKAMALDATAAEESTSWGIGQVMGHHARRLGFASAEAMVAAMLEGEDAQLLVMAKFIAEGKPCRQALIRHDWSTFARCYNGAAYAKNRYDERLAQQFRRWAEGPLPDLRVRSAQIYLTYRGFAPGPSDGLIGRFTRQALASFQQQQGLAVTGEPDDATMRHLAA
ncbi:DUF3380 domain-containing protein [Defluviicoccus vanus]|uniref:DUF3380 domain-containing protein n=1 Tax=Defluviicoccus vanus TaxID=111831 RepID=A0A7H1N5B1_9PROT|nr:DUF3380 domain-containing protein [Defluviicoccus vanus]